MSERCSETPLRCDQCGEEIDGTPTAFDINRWEYPEKLRFCNFYCLEAYDVDNSEDDDE